MSQSFFVTCPGFVEDLLRQELTGLGAGGIKTAHLGVSFTGTLEDAYRVCLWSRIAHNVLMPIATFQATNREQLYDAVGKIEWLSHLKSNGSFRIDVDGRTRFFKHSNFIGQVTKDAIVDQCRQLTRQRPDIVKDQPEVVIHAFCHDDQITLSICLSGESLHRRGYRHQVGLAPLKETAAAALLYRAGWPAIAREPEAKLVDPFCGSGTVVIEAALMATDTAPGLLREYFGFLRWRGHRAAAWENLIAEAKARQVPLTAQLFGYDQDKIAIDKAKRNAKAAGVIGIVFREQAVDALQLPEAPGIIVTNPPYNQRLVAELGPLYHTFGERLVDAKEWQVMIITENTEPLKNMPLRPVKKYRLRNGALDCTAVKFHITDTYQRTQMTHAEYWQHKVNQVAPDGFLTDNAKMLLNRLKKNKQHLKSWLKRDNVNCYRLYDADIPEYAVAIDIYDEHVHIAEYQAPNTIPRETSKKRFAEVVAVVHELLQTPYERIHVKLRRQQKGINQYEKKDETGVFHIVRENDAQLYVNFDDYLDTGLFLDHRLMRAEVAQAAAGKRLLNLFAYTCTASVHAALKGAKTTSVDLSKTYLAWGERNFKLNKFSVADHDFIHADCLQWLNQCKTKFDVIFLDPPTFSNSKRMSADNLDIQRDHIKLIRLALSCLAKGGVLYFSNNCRNFKMDYDALPEGVNAENISKRCLPMDFARRPKIHHCFEVRAEI